MKSLATAASTTSRFPVSAKNVGLRTFRRGGTTNARDNRVPAPHIDLHGRWLGRGTTTQDLYDANSIVRRVEVSGSMGATFGSGI